jgi:hypothetical protein
MAKVLLLKCGGEYFKAERSAYAGQSFGGQISNFLLANQSNSKKKAQPSLSATPFTAYESSSLGLAHRLSYLAIDALNEAVDGHRPEVTLAVATYADEAILRFLLANNQ